MSIYFSILLSKFIPQKHKKDTFPEMKWEREIMGSLEGIKMISLFLHSYSHFLLCFWKDIINKLFLYIFTFFLLLFLSLIKCSIFSKCPCLYLFMCRKIDTILRIICFDGQCDPATHSMSHNWLLKKIAIVPFLNESIKNCLCFSMKSVGFFSHFNFINLSWK